MKKDQPYHKQLTELARNLDLLRTKKQVTDAAIKVHVAALKRLAKELEKEITEDPMHQLFSPEKGK